MPGFFTKFGLTKRETLIIGFLLLAFAAGLIIKLSGWNAPRDYDYSPQDKNFDKQVKSAFTELEKNKPGPEQERKVNSLKRFSDSLTADKENSQPLKTEIKPDKKINLNSAYTVDLQLLPGIGEVMAERIIEYREQKGGFKTIEDIKKVKGIGDKKFDKIKEWITVE